MKRRGLRLGADLGGTWMRVTLLDEKGRVARRAKLRGGPWREAPKTLAGALRAWKVGRLESLTLGGKGLWKRADQLALTRALAGLARRVRVMSDLELAHRAAFGDGPGVLLIAGTGSAALGRTPEGRFARAGGWGPLLGDEGSAFWIGREALKDPKLSRLWPDGTALRVGRGADPVRATAALTRKVLARAAKGDAAAARLRGRAAEELAKIAREAAAGFGRRPVPLVLHGGMFRDDALTRAALRRLRPFRLARAARRPEDAAALL